MSKDMIPAGMREPEVLQTEAHLPWSRGRGVDVWAMFVAAMNGDLDTIKALEARDPGLLRCELEYFSPMHFAVRENQVGVVKYLLSRGVQPILAFEEPVWVAARMRGHEEMAVLLEDWVREKYGIRPEGEVIAAAIKSFDRGRAKELIEGAAARGDGFEAGGFGGEGGDRKRGGEDVGVE